MAHALRRYICTRTLLRTYVCTCTYQEIFVFLGESTLVFVSLLVQTQLCLLSFGCICTHSVLSRGIGIDDSEK